MKKFFWLFLLPFLLGAASQNTGWLTRSDCGTLTNAMTNGTVCLQTTTVSGRTAGHFYAWNGSAWIDVTGNIGAAITGLTGDVTASGPGSVGATIGNTKVTLPKIQNAVSSNKLLGSGATGSGSPYSEISLGTNLSMSGTTLNASGGGGGTGCNTSGTSILQGDGAGGCSNVTVGTGLDFTGGTLSAPGVAPDSAHYVTTQAESALSAEFNLGGLTDGLLKQTVSGGVSTPAIATAGTDYPAPGGSGCTVYVPPGMNNIQAAINALPATGGTICLGAGTYTQTGGPITLGDGTSIAQSTTYGIRIIGQSMPIMDLVNVITPSSATILDCTGTTNSDCLSLLGTQAWAIENLEIHGVGTGTNSVALKVTSSSFGHARNLRISGFNKGIWSTTWNSGSTTNHDSWGNLYDQITIFIATGGTHGFLIQGGDTVSNTDFNVLRSLNIFPPTGSVCMEFGFSDNNRTMDLNCIGTASGVDPTATSILFNYATGPREPLNNYFEGMDLSQHPIVNSGSPAENKPQLIFGFAEANSATCPNVVNVQVWGCSTSYGQQLRLSGGLQLWLGTGNAVTVNPITGTAAYNFNLPTGAGTAGQPLLSGGGGSTAQSYGTLGVAAGGTNLTAATDDNVMVGNGTTWESKAVPNCTDSGGNHLNYATATNTISCGTSSSGGGGGLTVIAKSANYTAVNGDLVEGDSSGGSFTVTLPASPATNDRIGVLLKTNSGSNTITIGRNGHNIDGAATDQILYVASDYEELQYDGAQWALVSQHIIPHKAQMKLGSVQSIADATVAKILLDHSDWDIGGIADPTTNHIITIRRAGKYLVVATWYCGATIAVNGMVQTRIHVNGSEYKTALQPAVGGTFASYLPFDTTVVDAAAGDTIELDVFQNSGSSQNTSTANEAQKPTLTVSEMR